MEERVLPVLWSYLDDLEHRPQARRRVMLGLERMADDHPALLPDIVTRLATRHQRSLASDREANAYLGHILANLGLGRVGDTVVTAFEEDKIDLGAWFISAS